ncbi:MAG: hypothetical protein OXC98_00100 [bacterium]|nr:hypothetical protein [Acidimicrobiia bacterium]MCY4648762.1 hypothetical protein [bacterium]
MIFTSQRGTLSAVIRWVTGESMTHCGTVVAVVRDENGLVEMHTVETFPFDRMLPRVRRENRDWAMDGKNKAPTVLKVLRPPAEEVEFRIAEVLMKIGGKYNYPGILELGMNYLMRKVHRRVIFMSFQRKARHAKSWVQPPHQDTLLGWEAIQCLASMARTNTPPTTSVRRSLSPEGLYKQLVGHDQTVRPE